ncbi:MaoC family dehydratase N-terminal domain-containing protein [Hyphomonas sp.]|uniref:FAS1-like dehydratase domain-containing protein n=1 Tax=Hyphomonas sp. TaxID=87 RepID=UPI00391D7D11
MDAATLESWTGRTEARTETLASAPAKGLAATLDQEKEGFGPGAELPPLWQWLYFLPQARASEMGRDGHPKLGGFLPPVALPRRMWAGSRCRFHAPLRIGEEAAKTSEILKVAEKSGRAGTMVFVTVRHVWSVGGEARAEEEQDIVYLPIPEVFAPPEAVAVPEGNWRERLAIDAVLLFRFSALTFNAHRIHYDRTYAMETEKYPGLVVHGPLQAMLLMEAARRWVPGLKVAAFEFRGLRPLFDHDEISVCGRRLEDGRIELHTCDGAGAAGMRALLTPAEAAG